MLTTCLASLDRARRRIANDASFEKSWICKTGIWPDSEAPKAAVLKLLKEHWSPDPRDSILSTTGIFFSVWSDEYMTGRLHYNLHALKLRELVIIPQLALGSAQ